VRALLVTALGAAALLVQAPAASGAPAASPTPSTKAPVALHSGDAITLQQLFGFLALPVHGGDWMRYRVTFADGPTVMKTIGFGSETVAGAPTLFIETYVHALEVTGLPPGSVSSSIGNDAVLKTYVVGDAFGDLNTPYRIVTSALKIGDLEYEVAPISDETYSALTGDVYSQVRDGVVRSIAPVDLVVGAQTVHASRIVASFVSVPLPAGGFSNGFTFEIWQSPDVPAGTVAISSTGSGPVRWRMLAYGRGYRSLFKNTLDQIRAQGQPAMP
jgi:hypothetical protein